MNLRILVLNVALAFAFSTARAEPEVSKVLGPLKLESSETEVVKAFGKPASKGKPEMWEAIGLYVREWRYPKIGLVLDMSSKGKNGPWSVERISAEAPCELATDLGIRIGSTEREVRKAYGKFEDKESSQPGESFVAGSVYGGIIFTFRDGKVSEILVGAAAE